MSDLENLRTMLTHAEIDHKLELQPNDEMHVLLNVPEDGKSRETISFEFSKSGTLNGVYVIPNPKQ